jgi:Flavodoxin
MKTAIIYASKHGATKEVARTIAHLLPDDEVHCISLRGNKNPDIRPYEKVILGTAIYAGNPISSMKSFCAKNRAELEKKTVGLYICCVLKEKQEEQFGGAFPDYLHRKAKSTAMMGGTINMHELSFFERLVTKNAANITESMSSLDHNMIHSFANAMK